MPNLCICTSSIPPVYPPNATFYITLEIIALFRLKLIANARRRPTFLHDPVKSTAQLCIFNYAGAKICYARAVPFWAFSNRGMHNQ